MNGQEEARLREMIEGRGMTAVEAARALGVKYHIVPKACKALGIRLYKGGKQPKHLDNGFWRARKKAGLSAEDAAEKIGVCRAAIQVRTCHIIHHYTTHMMLSVILFLPSPFFFHIFDTIRSLYTFQ